MKKYIIILFVGLSLCFNVALFGQEVVDGIIAIVGDEIVLRTEMLQAAQALAVQMGVNPRTQTDEFRQIKKDVLQNLINEKVLLAKAIEDTITVTDQQVESALEERIGMLINQLGSQEKVEAYFGTPIKKIRRDYREEIRKGLTVRQVQEGKMRPIMVSRREVEEFYETMKDSLPDQKPMVHLRHLLKEIRPGGSAREKAVRKIRDIQELVRQGEDFGELAKQYSEDPGSASSGGNLGFVEKGTLFHEFEEVAFQLEIGETSDVVETPIGFHLIQTLEKRGDKANMRHILVRLTVSESDDDDALAEISHLRTEVINGTDFEALAKEHSDDESTKEAGGDLGWLPIGELQIDAFKSAVDTLEVNETTMPFKTQFGFHIVRLDGRTDARPISLEDDWDQITNWALNLKRQKIMAAWVEELKKNIYIKVNEDLI